MKSKLRVQFSLRMVFVTAVLVAVPLGWFAPQLRAAFAQYFTPIPDVTFSSTSAADSQRWSSFAAMHSYFVQQFVESEGFGFSRIMRLDEPYFRELVVNGRPYQLQRMELVSINGSGEPFAYVNDFYNPTKERLPTAEHRALTEFELSAVKKIKVGREVVYNGDAEQPVLVGDIRATRSCLECHSVKPGELLGCMTYELRPASSYLEALYLTPVSPGGG